MKAFVLALTVSLFAVTAGWASDAATEAANIAVVKTQIDIMNRGDWKTALDYYSDSSRNFGRAVGRAVMARIFEDIYTTFPDWHVDI